MPTNYKNLYEQMKKMVTMYQDEIVPGMREQLEKCAEVVHAEWLDGCAIHNGKEAYQSIDCSHCNDIFKIESHDREYWKKRFKVCPFCGAVMDVKP